MKNKKIFAILLALALFSAGVYLIYDAYNGFIIERQRRAFIALKRQGWLKLKRTLESEVAAFKGDAGIIIKDMDTGWVISLNKDKPFPAASLLKIPIMAACFNASSNGKISLNDKLVLKASVKTLGSGVLKTFPSGSKFTVEKLIEFMITKSDNTATNMLIGYLGPEYLNGFFRDYGLSDTVLNRKMMDFRQRKKGVENYTSARDIAFILERIYKRELLNRDVSDKCLSLLLRQEVNDRIPAKLPDEVAVAHKTGLEKNICHDAGIVFAENGHFMICVLTKSKNGTRQVKEFISDISLHIYKNYKMYSSSKKS